MKHPVDVQGRLCTVLVHGQIGAAAPMRSTQLLKVNARDFSWGRGGRCVWLTTYHPCSAETSRKSWALTNLEPLGPVAGNLYFIFYCFRKDGLQVLPNTCKQLYKIFLL